MAPRPRPAVALGLSSLLLLPSRHFPGPHQWPRGHLRPAVGPQAHSAEVAVHFGGEGATVSLIPERFWGTESELLVVGKDLRVWGEKIQRRGSLGDVKGFGILRDHAGMGSYSFHSTGCLQRRGARKRHLGSCFLLPFQRLFGK